MLISDVLEFLQNSTKPLLNFLPALMQDLRAKDHKTFELAELFLCKKVMQPGYHASNNKKESLSITSIHVQARPVN